MTVKPLFIKDRSTLLESLRLSGGNESSSQQIDDAILEVRTGLYRELGAARVSQISAYTRSETPATSDELTRAEAELVERRWVRLVLMRVMPTFFMEGTSQHQQVWNQEGLLRDADRRLERLMDELQSAVSCGLGGLKTGVPCAANVAVIGPETTNTYPGSALFT